MRERSHDRRENRCYGTGTARSEYTHLVCAVYSRGVLGESGSRGLEGDASTEDLVSRLLPVFLNGLRTHASRTSEVLTS